MTVKKRRLTHLLADVAADAAAKRGFNRLVHSDIDDVSKAKLYRFDYKFLREGSQVWEGSTIAIRTDRGEGWAHQQVRERIPAQQKSKLQYVTFLQIDIHDEKCQCSPCIWIRQQEKP